MMYKKIVIYTLAAVAAMAACKKESPAPGKQDDTKKIAAEAKRKEIHAYFRDSIKSAEFIGAVNYYLPKTNKTIKDTTLAVPQARNDYLASIGGTIQNPRNTTGRKAVVLGVLCSEYDALVR